MLLAQHMPRWDTANRHQLLLVVHTVIELSIQGTYLNVSPSVFKLFLSSQFKKKIYGLLWLLSSHGSVHLVPNQYLYSLKNVTLIII